MKYGCLRVVEAVGYGLSAAKEKTSIAFIFLRGIPTFIGYTPRNKRSRLASSAVPTSVGVQPGGRSGGRKGLEAAKFVFSGGMTPKCKKNNHKILIFNGQKKYFTP